MMYNKKAQAAMEFLMTYGWAILVVLVVIGALAYFGVLNPTATLPEKCFLPLGLNCEEHLIKSATTGGAKFMIRNGMGSTIEISSFAIMKEGDVTVCNRTYATRLLIKNGEAGSVLIPSSATATAFDGASYSTNSAYCDLVQMGNAGTKYKYSIEVAYNKEGKTDYVHSVTGELLAKLE